MTSINLPRNLQQFRKKIKSLLLNVLGDEDNYLNVNYLIEYFVKLTWYVVYTSTCTFSPFQITKSPVLEFICKVFLSGRPEGKAREIIRIWTKRSWNYSLISLVTIWLHILIYWLCSKIENAVKSQAWLALSTKRVLAFLKYNKGDLAEGRKVTLLFSTYVSWPPPSASVTSHSNGQELRVACANKQEIPQLLLTSEVEENLRS